MPLKDKDAKLAYQREWYAKNKEKVIKKVRARKWKDYAGTCRNCGRPTMGQSKGQAPEFCGRAGCRSAHHKENREVFAAAGRAGRSVQLGKARAEKRKKIREKEVVSIDELSSAY